MFENIGFGELLIIFVVLIVFFGPKRIPDVAQSIGKGIREFKRAMKDVQDEVTKSVNEEPKSGPKERKEISEPLPNQDLSAHKKSGAEVKS
jgi:sec-independent protein translocase protein TatA